MEILSKDSQNKENNLHELLIRAMHGKTQKQFDGEFKISVNITAKSLLWDIEDCIEDCDDETFPTKIKLPYFSLKYLNHEVIELIRIMEG